MTDSEFLEILQRENKQLIEMLKATTERIAVLTAQRNELFHRVKEIKDNQRV